ncbi:MAG: hypothetical protein WDO68_20730 [Gammaproteobacteria bacterium]
MALTQQGRNREALRIAQELLRNQPDNPHYLSLVRELKMQTHWTMLPLYPMQRWGWGGAAAVSVAGIIGVRALGQGRAGAVSERSRLHLARVCHLQLGMALDPAQDDLKVKVE